MIRRYVLAFTALAAACGAHAAPLEAYGQLPSVERVEVSPSGAYIAFTVTNGGQRTVAVQNASDHKLKLATSAGVQKVRDIRWASDDHLIVTASTTTVPTFIDGPADEYFLAVDLNLQAGRQRGLLEKVQEPADPHHPRDTINVILGRPIVRTVDGKPVAFIRGWSFQSSEGQIALFRVDLESGVATVVDEGGSGAYDWAVSAQGQPVAKASYADASGTWKLAVKPGRGVWRTALSLPAPIDRPELQGLGRDEHSALIEMNDDKEGWLWREMSLETGAWGEVLSASSGESPIEDPRSGRLIGSYALVGDAPTYSFIDPHDAAVWRAVTKAFPGDLVSLASWSDDRQKIVVLVDSAAHGPAYFLVDLTTGSAVWLADKYVGLKEADISPVRPVRYKAADGLEIPGYLTLPRGRDPHGLPLVVLAHGGPASRDTPGFDWWAQALASRGYAVLQANFRGSEGYGRDFLDAGFNEWGRKMQTDLSDGVRALAADGTIDPKRVCIVGASYGGYAALAGATIDHGVYRCAVSYGGVADLRGLVSDSASKDGRGAQRYWLRFIGSKTASDPVLARYSPVARAAEADIPVLLIHGRDDTVVPISQSRRMAEALRTAGKPVDLIELPGEDHWLSTGETRLQMLQATVAFLDKNNPPN